MNAKQIINFFSRRADPCPTTLAVNQGLLARFNSELRSQLSTIVEYAEFLEGKKDESMTNFTAKIIRENGDSLIKACNSFYELNHLTKGRGQLSSSNFVLSDLVLSEVNRFHKQAWDRGVNLEFSCRQNQLNRVVNVDKERLQQALNALIYGLLQMMAKGSLVHVILESSEKHLGGCALVINITGINSNHGRVLDLHNDFWMNDKYSFQLQEGPGVILAFAKSLLALLGASFYFQSNAKLDNFEIFIDFFAIC
jgi:signal transduction histidine kinase